MTRHMRRFVLILVLGALAHPSLGWAARYKYSELQLKDYDAMLEKVKGHVRKATEAFRDDGDETIPDQTGVDHLREALTFILSRPNQDNMLAKLLPEVRKELANVNAFEDSLAGIVAESLDGLNNKKLPTVYRSTYLLIIENVLSEFKPEIRDREEIRQVFEKIRDANIKIPKEVARDLKLRSMLQVESPSERARRILTTLAKDQKANAKKK